MVDWNNKKYVKCSCVHKRRTYEIHMYIWNVHTKFRCTYEMYIRNLDANIRKAIATAINLYIAIYNYAYGIWNCQ